jgi:hypothetical protein
MHNSLNAGAFTSSFKARKLYMLAALGVLVALLLIVVTWSLSQQQCKNSMVAHLASDRQLRVSSGGACCACSSSNITGVRSQGTVFADVTGKLVLGGIKPLVVPGSSKVSAAVSNNCSRDPAQPGTVPEMPSGSKMFPRMITYANHCCGKSKTENCQAALRYGFKSCKFYGLSDLPLQALSPGGREVLLNRQRGAGYWLWKPLIIWTNLLEARDGDILMYSDAGSKMMADASPLLELLSQQDVVGFSLDYIEYNWTKRDAFLLLNGDEFNSTNQVLSSFVLLRRSAVSLGFISQWLSYAQDSRAVTDDPNILGKDNYPGFCDHRHDQSVFSLLYKRWNFTTYDDPSQWGNNISTRPYPQLINHTRDHS